MANRKQELDSAVAQSRQESAERAASQAPQAEVKPSSPTAGFKLPYTQQREAEAAAPFHPRAIKGSQVRQRELDAGMAAGREQRTSVETAGKEKLAAGEGTVGTEYKTVAGHKDTNKKVGVRQVKAGKRKVINSGTVVLGTDYEEVGTVRRPKAVTSGQSKAKLNMLDVDAAAKKAEDKFLKRPKPKKEAKGPKPAGQMRFNKNIAGVRITPGKKK